MRKSCQFYKCRRHAGAKLIIVKLDELDDKVAVSVTDDGQGFDPEAAAADSRMRFGLSIMRARASRLKGTVQIETALGKGTKVTLSWPLSATTFTMATPLE